MNVSNMYYSWNKVPLQNDVTCSLILFKEKNLEFTKVRFIFIATLYQII